jgi:uncharacterized protein
MSNSFHSRLLRMTYSGGILLAWHTTEAVMIVGHQEWEHLLFVHYQVDQGVLRSIVPAPLELDLFEGQAWVTIIPFRIRGSRPALVPRAASPVVPASDFVELNFRTYVRAPNGEAGIWFFSLDASSRLAVAGARMAYGLPYENAEMSFEIEEGTLVFSSKRIDAPQTCTARYRPAGIPSNAEPGNLDHFLVERYVLFTVDEGRVSGARVRHHPYPIQDVELEEWSENLLVHRGFAATDFSLTHYSAGLSVDITAPFRVERGNAPSC